MKSRQRMSTVGFLFLRFVEEQGRILLQDEQFETISERKTLRTKRNNVKFPLFSQATKIIIIL